MTNDSQKSEIIKFLAIFYSIKKIVVYLAIFENWYNKSFKCLNTRCGWIGDADENGSKMIALVGEAFCKQAWRLRIIGLSD